MASNYAINHGINNIPIEVGSTTTHAPTGSVRLFQDSENDNVLTQINSSGDLFIVDEFVDETAATTAALESS